MADDQISKEDQIKRLEERVNRLSHEKSHLQIMADLFSEMAPLSGFENIIDHCLEVLMNAIGGSNVSIYCREDDRWFYRDIQQKSLYLERIEDPMVQKVISNKELLEEKSDSLMLLDDYQKMPTSAAWAFPMTVGDDLIGVLKIDGLMLDYPDTLMNQLEIFIAYVGLALKNEIMSRSKLQKAYNQLHHQQSMLKTEIYEREKAEHELRTSQSFLEKAQAIGSIGTWSFDVKKNKLTWTDENYRIFGVPFGADLTYEVFLNCVHLDDREFVDTRWTAALKGEPYDIEHRLTVDGKTKWVREKAELEFDEEGFCLGGTGVTQDITYRKTEENIASAQLKIIDFAQGHNLESLLQKFLDEAEALTESKIGFFHFVEEDQQNLQLQTWSTNTIKKMCKTGTVQTHYPISDAGVWVDCVKEGKPVIHNDYASLPHKKGLPDGHAPIIRELVVPVYQKESIVAIFGVGNKESDYTEQDVNALERLASQGWETITRKQAEERKKELKEQLMRAERMKSLGVLAGGVAHDLNNVLGPMVMLSDLIKSDFSDIKLQDSEAEARMRESLDVIKASAKRASIVVRDLVALSRRGQGNRTAVDINHLLLAESISPEAGELSEQYPDVKISRDIPETELTILASEDHIMRVFANLIRNAAEAVEGKGEVTVRSYDKELLRPMDGYVTVPAGKYAVVEVTDTGKGIEKEDMNRIFEPFFTKKKKSERSGSGLGLSVVHGIVSDHEGFIDVKTETGKGSTFTVYLPAIEREVSTEEESEKEIARGKGNILVVDDEPAQRFLAKHGLKKLGYSVIEASEGHEAVELYRKADDGKGGSAFDLIILDMIMEDGFDGLDTYNDILKINSSQKVIIATGHASNERIKAAERLGADILYKPYEITDLAEAVHSRLDRS